MAIRLVLVCALTLIGISEAVVAQGEWLTNPLYPIVRDVKRRQCWPRPFVCADIETVNTPFAVMTDNGWQHQNTLTDAYFEPTTGQLTEAGQLKIRWILTEAPEQHRGVFVLQADSVEETAARINAVQQYGARFLPVDVVLPVQQTAIAPRGWPADRVDFIGRKFQSSTPAPKLPGASGSGGSSSPGQ